MATILVVDDLAANREVLVSLLRYKGHRLLEAVNGRDALDVVQKERPDLVITDVLMPVMDGYELVRQLRLELATSRIPIVFYTAHYGEREARELAASSGVAHVLTKPVEPETVLDVVASVLSGEAASERAADLAPLSPEFDREHLRLVTDKLLATDEDLRAANARLRALINIGLELASEKHAGRLIENVCVSARDLFGASYVTLGIVNGQQLTMQNVLTSGIEADDWAKIGENVPGILSSVVAERRMMRGANTGGDPAALGLPAAHPRIDAFLAAPIASPANVYGWLCLAGNEGRSFSEDDEHLLMALSGQVGRIYENGHYYAVARQERDRSQRYLDTADVMLLALDLGGRITLINRKGCDLLQWTERELIGRDWMDACLPSRIREGQRAKFHGLLGGDVSITQNPILTRSGTERLIEWRNTVLRDDHGHAIGTFSSGTDITEQHQAIEALRTGEERMRFALQASDVGIWDMDYTTGVLRWSETLEAHYGLAPGTFGGTFEEFVALIHPDDRASALETVGNAMKSGKDFSVLNRALKSDGTVRWLQGAGRVILNARGEPVRGVGISMDVTERRALEEQYHQAQKMEAVGRLAGGIAHDFNNLLTAILGFSELLLSERTPEDPAYADLAEIQKAGVRASSLTRQLLAFSRKQIIEPTLLDVNEVVGSMQGMLARLIGEDVKIVMGMKPELASVKADRGQLEQIVMNLAINARDAMPDGGTLTIETANVELDDEYAQTHLNVKPGPYVALTVTDTGTGIPEKVLARLFEPFFTTKDPGKGTGLGLATIHGIVSRAGGSVGVYSEVGRGTSFKVYLPHADGSEPAVESAPAVTREHDGVETVLVVEDAEGLRELAKRMLTRQGYAVLVASNADEAVKLFEQNPAIDVLLTDVVMPGASGPELTRQLIERRPSLKVLYMSGYTEDAITHHGVLNPGIAFIHKPFTAHSLGQKLREVLDR